MYYCQDANMYEKVTSVISWNCPTNKILQIKGINPGEDGGNVFPTCFDMGGGGITCLLSPPHVLTVKTVGFFVLEN